MQINRKPKVNYSELIKKKLKNKEIKENFENTENSEKDNEVKYIENIKQKLLKKKLVFRKKNINKEKGKSKLAELMKENEKLKKELEELEKEGNEEKSEDSNDSFHRNLNEIEKDFKKNK
jgi:hypothetical protein